MEGDGILLICSTVERVHGAPLEWDSIQLCPNVILSKLNPFRRDGWRRRRRRQQPSRLLGPREDLSLFHVFHAGITRGCFRWKRAWRQGNVSRCPTDNRVSRLLVNLVSGFPWLWKPRRDALMAVIPEIIDPVKLLDGLVLVYMGVRLIHILRSN